MKASPFESVQPLTLEVFNAELGEVSSELALKLATEHLQQNYVCIPKKAWDNATKVYGDKSATKWSTDQKSAIHVARIFDVRKIPFDVEDWRKGMLVKILGGNDLWTVNENGEEDDIQLVNNEGVCISCDYRRLVFIEAPSK